VCGHPRVERAARLLVAVQEPGVVLRDAAALWTTSRVSCSKNQYRYESEEVRHLPVDCLRTVAR
jgi:hypothetical protein